MDFWLKALQWNRYKIIRDRPIDRELKIQSEINAVCTPEVKSLATKN